MLQILSDELQALMCIDIPLKRCQHTLSNCLDSTVRGAAFASRTRWRSAAILA